ncbi:MAG: hypothetical protein GF341_02775 [candidate division Zixibacteria bacterium]|nr:hypothetical protein [candidate division Zixibacteria bacterium]
MRFGRREEFTDGALQVLDANGNELGQATLILLHPTVEAVKDVMTAIGSEIPFDEATDTISKRCAECVVGMDLPAGVTKEETWKEDLVASGAWNAILTPLLRRLFFRSNPRVPEDDGEGDPGSGGPGARPEGEEQGAE